MYQLFVTRDDLGVRKDQCLTCLKYGWMPLSKNLGNQFLVLVGETESVNQT